MNQVPLHTARCFIGRQRELASLWDRFSLAGTGRTAVALVSGEPGIGKTRLLDELAQQAAGVGATILRGGACEAEGMPPYLPFLEALGHHVRAAPLEQLRLQTGSFAPVLATIMPELSVRLGQLPAGYPLPAEQARLRLFQAVGSILRAIGAPTEGPAALLILDDLQWADAASLDLLWHLARYQPDARLLILGAYRASELGANSALERILTELARLRVLTTLSLAPLAPDEIASLAEGYLGGSLDPALAHLLGQQSEGNPFFAEELLLGWRESGALVWREGPPPRWGLKTQPDGLPPTIIGAIRQRLARLPTPVVDLLRVTAIIGRTTDVALLAQVVGREVETIEDLLRTAERAGLVHSDGRGGYAFAHDMTRECLYTEVSSARRRRLHEEIGQALEVETGQRSTRSPAELAFHFARSGDRARGAVYSRQAAEEALRAYAPQQALAHYQTALDLLDPRDESRGEHLLGLGRAALLAALEEMAAKAYREAQAWFERIGDPVATARAAHGHGLARWRLDDPLAAEEALQTALRLLETANWRGPETVWTQVDLASLLGIVLGRHDEALAHGRQALALAHSLGDNRLEAAASRTLGFMQVRANELADGVPLLERALALASAHDDPAEAAECCACLAQAYCWSGNLARSRQISRQREVFARRCQQPYHLCYVHTWLAFLAAARGDWDQAEARLTQAGPAVGCVASDEPSAFLRQVQGFLAFQQGDLARAEAEFRAAIQVFRRHDPGELVLCLGPLALTLCALDREREAEQLMVEQTTLVNQLALGRLSALSAAGCLGLLAVKAEDHKLAARLYQDLLACQGQHHWFLVDRILGQLALLLGDHTAAGAHLAAAEATARREGLRPELARTLAAQADLALAVARPPGGAARRASIACDLLDQALGLCEGLGWAEEARRLRRRRPGGRASALPAGLSRREAQVLKLVTAGMSNRQIAQELALSESTVAKHLTAIFNKTACENRAAAAAFAIRHDLA